MKVEKNEKVVLIEENLRRYFVDTNGKTDKIKGVGVFDPKIILGEEYGKQIMIGDKKLWVLKPSLMDKMMGLKRKAQIILPRDASHIIMNCSIEPGHKVIEAGIGSGSLTIALANAVGPDGHVYSYDNRMDFIDHAKKNLRMADVKKLVTIRNRDVTQGFDEKNVDALILDIPNPWDAISHVWKTLKTGGYFCSYSPLVSQVEKTVKEIGKHGFIDVRTFENIQREIIVSDHGTRPSFSMLGHTGYLTFARKILL